MKLLIAGKDRSADVGSAIEKRAAELEGPVSDWEPEESALSLKHCSDSSEYFDRFCRLMRLRRDVGPSFLQISDRAARGASKVGMFSRLFRGSQDKAMFQQNVINELMVSAFDFQQSVLWQKIADLEKKVEGLEAEIRAAKGRHAGGRP